jgi:hypothetical protein
MVLVLPGSNSSLVGWYRLCSVSTAVQVLPTRFLEQ